MVTYIYQSSPLLPERSAPLLPALPWELLTPQQGQNWKASGPGSIHPHKDIFKGPEPTYTCTRPAKRPALGDREPSAPQLGNKQETGMVVISRQTVGASCPATPGEGAPPQTHCPRGDGKAERHTPNTWEALLSQQKRQSQYPSCPTLGWWGLPQAPSHCGPQPRSVGDRSGQSQVPGMDRERCPATYSMIISNTTMTHRM